MADPDRFSEAQNAILDRIIEVAPHHKTATGLLALAEAFAWASMPGQPHGSTSRSA